MLHRSVNEDAPQCIFMIIPSVCFNERLEWNRLVLRLIVPSFDSRTIHSVKYLQEEVVFLYYCLLFLYEFSIFAEK